MAKKKSSASASSRATKSSAVEAGPNASKTASASSTTKQHPIPKLRIPARKPSHSTTPTTATPTTTRAPSPTRSNGSSDESSPKIAPGSPPETEFSKVQVCEALKSLRRQGPSNTQSTGVLEEDIIDSEESGSEVEILDDAEVERPWSPLLQPNSPPRRKVKRKRGVSDVSRDQVSTEESPGPAAIDEEEEEDWEELELEGMSMHYNFCLATSNAHCFRH